MHVCPSIGHRPHCLSQEPWSDHSWWCTPGVSTAQVSGLCCWELPSRHGHRVFSARTCPRITTALWLFSSSSAIWQWFVLHAQAAPMTTTPSMSLQVTLGPVHTSTNKDTAIEHLESRRNRLRKRALRHGLVLAVYVLGLVYVVWFLIPLWRDLMLKIQAKSVLSRVSEVGNVSSRVVALPVSRHAHLKPNKVPQPQDL